MSFEDFWAIYPRRVAKLAAKRKYEAALKHATEAEILAGARAYAAVTARTEMQYIKHPATWLHGGCWEDDMAAVAPRSLPAPPQRQTMAGLFTEMGDFFDEQSGDRGAQSAAGGAFLSLPFDGRKH